jgi:cytochrome c5
MSLRRVVGLCAVLGLLAPPVVHPAGAQPQAAIDLQQGWTDAVREAFWFQTQGSRMMPYDWFAALEQASDTALLRDPAFLESLGYITVGASPANPLGLPIGFTKDEDVWKRSYVGLTCSACHTARLTIAGTPTIVEGGQALSDFSGFLSAVVGSLEATLADAAKFRRFADRVGAKSATARAVLRKGLEAQTQTLKKRRDDNTPTEAYGFGRVDAFGHIFNQVFVADVGLNANLTKPDAPVSYPFLWDTPQHDFVQWNGSAPNADLGALFRNVGELLGVFGTVDVKKSLFGLPDYPSSVRQSKLVPLEDMVVTLFSPVWPKNVLPVDQALATRGAEIYKQTCVECHKPIDRTDPNRTITAVMTPLQEAGTDPAMTLAYIQKLAQLPVQTGPLNGREIPPGRFGASSPGGPVLTNVVLGAFVGQLLIAEKVAFKKQAAQNQAMLQRSAAMLPRAQYKTRPLNGVWATAPFLHNGSVPSLAELLKPPADRVKGFWVGSRVFDPDLVGLSTAKDTNAFWFDTTRPGNSNAGHAWGTALSPEDKRALLEYLKTL